MKDTLAPGIQNTEIHTITADLSTGHAGGTPMLSTPSMIGLMEGVCLKAVAPHLDDDETTVGIHVSVSHVAASVVDEKVTVACTLREVNKRRLVFDVSAHVGDRLLGEGTHQRAVIKLK